MTTAIEKRVPRYDKFSGSNIIVVSEHAHIHRGQAYTCSQSFGLGAGETADITLTTPQSVTPHLRVFTTDLTSAPADMTFYEGPFTIENTGTLIQPQNLSRESTNVTSVTVSFTSSVTLTGSETQLEYHLINGARQSGGSTPNATSEWDLKGDTSYLLRVTNRGAGAVDAGALVFFYQPR